MTWSRFHLPVLLLSLGLCIYGLYGLADYQKQSIPWLKRACYWFAISPTVAITAFFALAIVRGVE